VTKITRVLRKASLVRHLNWRQSSTLQDAMQSSEALKPNTPQRIIPINKLISPVREEGSVELQLIEWISCYHQGRIWMKKSRVCRTLLEDLKAIGCRRMVPVLRIVSKVSCIVKPSEKMLCVVVDQKVFGIWVIIKEFRSRTD